MPHRRRDRHASVSSFLQNIAHRSARCPLAKVALTTRCHACCSSAHGFSPFRRFTPRDGVGYFATRAGRGSLRCWHNRPPPPGKPRSGGTSEMPFPQRGHPMKNLSRQQAAAPHDASDTLMGLPPSQCRPEDPTWLLGPLQGVAPPTIVDLRAHRCRFAWWPASSHGLLYLPRLRSRSSENLQDVT